MVILLYHMHTCLLPIANAVVMQVPSFHFCALPFATEVVLWTTQTLLFTKWNLAWEPGFEFQCIQGLLFFFSFRLFWALLWSSLSLLGLLPARPLWHGNVAVCPGWTPRCHHIVLYHAPWPWCTVQRYASRFPGTASLRAATLCVYLEMHWCRFHRKASFSSV